MVVVVVMVGIIMLFLSVVRHSVEWGGGAGGLRVPH